MVCSYTHPGDGMHRPLRRLQVWLEHSKEAVGDNQGYTRPFLAARNARGLPKEEISLTESTAFAGSGRCIGVDLADKCATRSRRRSTESPPYKYRRG